MAIVAKKLSQPLVDKKQLVAVRVAGQMVHAVLRPPMAKFEIGVAQQKRRVPRPLDRMRQSIRIERPRSQRPLKSAPAGGRMAVDHLRRWTKKTFFAELPFKSVGWHARVSLTRGFAFDMRK